MTDCIEVSGPVASKVRCVILFIAEIGQVTAGPRHIQDSKKSTLGNTVHMHGSLTHFAIGCYSIMVKFDSFAATGLSPDTRDEVLQCINTCN